MLAACYYLQKNSSMKKIVFILLSFILITSCSKTVLVKTNGNGKVPPGQMKKATGSKSAAPYAPGQQKKAADNNGNGNKNKKKQ